MSRTFVLEVTVGTDDDDAVSESDWESIETDLVYSVENYCDFDSVDPGSTECGECGCQHDSDPLDVVVEQVRVKRPAPDAIMIGAHTLR